MELLLKGAAEEEGGGGGGAEAKSVNEGGNKTVFFCSIYPPIIFRETDSLTLEAAATPPSSSLEAATWGGRYRGTHGLLNRRRRWGLLSCQILKNFYTFAILKGGSGGPKDEPCQYAAAVAWTKQGDDRVIVSVVSTGKEEEEEEGKGFNCSLFKQLSSPIRKKVVKPKLILSGGVSLERRWSGIGFSRDRNMVLRVILKQLWHRRRGMF